MSDLIRVSQSRLIETRASVPAVASPVDFYQPKQALHPTWDADNFVKNGYLAQTYVFKCVDKTASALSRVPYRVGTDPDNPTAFRKNAKLALLIGPGGKPAPGWTPKMWWKYIFSQFRIMGKFACFIERDFSGEIVALWPLQAQHLRPIPDTSPRPKGYFAAFEYGSFGAPGYKKFRPDEVMYCWEPSPDDPRQPLSVIQAAKLDISVAQLINEYDLALLRNNAVPSTIVTTEPFADDPSRRGFRQQFMAKFSGSGNAGKTMFLEADPDEGPDGQKTNNVAGKIHVERLGMSSQEMQSPEKRAATINDITVAFSTPLSVLGDSTNAKFTNMESDYRNWWADTLLPLGDYVCDLINVALAPQVDPGRRYVGWFDFSGIGALKEAPRFSLTDLVAAKEAGAIDRDELRREIGLAPWDDVDHPEEEIEAPAAPLPPAIQPDQTNTLEVSRGPLASAVPRPLTKALAASVRHSLIQQKAAIEQRAKGFRGDLVSLNDVFDYEYWEKRHSEDMAPIFEGISEYRAIPERFIARIAKQIVDDTVARNVRETSVEAAYDDIEQRAQAVAETVIRMLEEIPADHMSVVLNAISSGKMTPAQALKAIS